MVTARAAGDSGPQRTLDAKVAEGLLDARDIDVYVHPAKWLRPARRPVS